MKAYGINSYEDVRLEISKRAYELWNQQEFQRIIRSEIQKVLTYNRAFEYEDYHQEAFIGVIAGVERYNRLHKRKNGNGNSNGKVIMQLRTFAFWYVKKCLHRMADVGEIVRDMFDSDGNYVDTLTEKEYLRQKKKREAQGYSFKAFSLRMDFPDMIDQAVEDSLFPTVPDFGKENFSRRLQRK